MYAYFRADEHRTVVGPYLHGQLGITAKMRAILVDWLCEVDRSRFGENADQTAGASDCIFCDIHTLKDGAVAAAV